MQSDYYIAIALNNTSNTKIESNYTLSFDVQENLFNGGSACSFWRGHGSVNGHTVNIAVGPNDWSAIEANGRVEFQMMISLEGLVYDMHINNVKINGVSISQ